MLFTLVQQDVHLEAIENVFVNRQQHTNITYVHIMVIENNIIDYKSVEANSAFIKV